MTGGANEDSDLDFYLLCQFRDFLYYAKHREICEPIKAECPPARLVFVPWYLFNRGYYYIYGRDIDGKIYASKVDKRHIFRNSLKLACFHFLEYAVCPGGARLKFLKKAARMTASALMAKELEECGNRERPLLSEYELKKYLSGSRANVGGLLLEIMNWNDSDVNLDDNMINGASEKLWRGIREIFETAGGLLSFSALSYAIYNFKFLKRRDARFLFSNPDTLILKKIINGLVDGAEARELRDEAKNVVFPVYII